MTTPLPDPYMASEHNPHPDIPDGPWARFGDCTECGSTRGFPCTPPDGPDGQWLRYAHTTRKLDPTS